MLHGDFLVDQIGSEWTIVYYSSNKNLRESGIEFVIDKFIAMGKFSRKLRHIMISQHALSFVARTTVYCSILRRLLTSDMAVLG